MAVGAGVEVGAGSCEVGVGAWPSPGSLSGKKTHKATNTVPVTKLSRRGNIPSTGSFISLTSNPPPSKAMTISASPTKKVMDTIENGTLSISLHTNPDAPTQNCPTPSCAGFAKSTVNLSRSAVCSRTVAGLKYQPMSDQLGATFPRYGLVRMTTTTFSRASPEAQFAWAL